MHRDACRATTEERKRSFMHNIEEDCNTFPCARCKIHFRNFLDNYPLKQYWLIKDDKGRDIGFFKWTWELHNQVNRRLRKYEPKFEEAYNYYTQEPISACFNCDNNKEQENNEVRSLPIPQILLEYLEKQQSTNTTLPGIPIPMKERSIIKHI